MFVTNRRPMRGLIGVCVALAVVAGACGSSSSTPGIPGLPTMPGGLPTNPGGALSTDNGGGGSSLTSGLAANLDNLKSYQFSETIAGSSSDASPSADSGGSTISGTVINQPDKRMWVNYGGTQFITIGTQTWTSDDGTTWTAFPAGSAMFGSMLPSTLYLTYFDSFSSNYKSVGDDTQNNIPCTHYQGDSSISGMYAALAGVGATITADLWVAKDGGYPVKGVLAMTASSGGKSGSFGYKLDVTHVNDAAANVVSEPSVAPAAS